MSQPPHEPERLLESLLSDSKTAPAEPSSDQQAEEDGI